MGVSKGEEGGRWSPPNGWRSLVLGEGGPCRIWRSGGFPKFPGKSSPSSPSSHPFPPLLLPLDPLLNSPSPQTSPSNSLVRAFISPHYPFLPYFLSLTLFLPHQGPCRTSSEHLRNPSIGSPKGLKQPFLGLFRGTPETPKKGLKTPFLTPFSPLPYPL